MKRDWDLTRTLLEAIDEHPRFHPDAPFNQGTIAADLEGDFPDEVVNYHLTLHR
ncbi:hypothetical protein [Paraburkholderia sediminicola]|jgi:hypothetical protein|uniref:hypothetical protein n=1 Tax=Paraburkholderia sediminicola TaxID=458836 RepID=UPI0038BD1FEB